MPHTFLTDAEASDLSADEYERYRRLRGPAYRAPLLPRTAADRMNDADIRAIVHRVSATRADGSIPFTDLANFCTDLQLPPESLGVRHVAALPAAVLLALRRRERCWPGQDTNTAWRLHHEARRIAAHRACAVEPSAALEEVRALDPLNIINDPGPDKDNQHHV